MLELKVGDAHLSLHPQMGGGIAGLWHREKPVLRPWSGQPDEGPFALASNVLVPFSNRIDGGFTFDGTYHPMAKNMEGDPFAIHGDGFQREWLETSSSDSEAMLTLEAGSFGPYSYRATQTFTLTETTFVNSVTMTNTADIALPFGGGFHPWFPRSDKTRLKATAPEHWPEGAGTLPATDRPQSPPEDFDFSSGRALPDRKIDCAFTSWNGKARIEQGDDAVSLTLTSKTLTTAIIYSPDPHCGFFCFEPVSHPINAHNLPGMPGLQVLRPMESLSMSMTFDWSAR